MGLEQTQKWEFTMKPTHTNQYKLINASWNQNDARINQSRKTFLGPNIEKNHRLLSYNVFYDLW
jgi:hypothetical protein